jgi:hypothetical protein
MALQPLYRGQLLQNALLKKITCLIELKGSTVALPYSTHLRSFGGSYNHVMPRVLLLTFIIAINKSQLS